MAEIRLDVVSDVVCPWCWLGKRRLEAAIAAAPELTVEVAWRPFQLDPDMPPEGRPYKDAMRAKFAAAPDRDALDASELGGGFAAMRAHLEAAAPAAGVRFRFSDIPIRPNTFDAHRLIRWAEGQGKGAEAVEALFRAFFDELRDIGGHDTLAAIAGEVGLDAALVSDLLARDADRETVQAEEAFFRGLGVRGVPTFIANGALAITGAQEPAVLAAFLREAAGETAAAAAS